LSQKLEESGVNQKVSTFMNQAADKTMQVGTKIYVTSADTLQTIAQTQVYQEISEKSKVAFGHVSEKI
jgi:2-methylaconitate cis-trans-isomerase PrpF